SLVDAVLRWHRKLRALGGVTGVAQLVLFLREQVFRRGRMVDRVTARAGDIVERVLRAADIRAAEILRVTSQARLQRLLLRHQRECARNARLAAARFHVLLRRSVAPFTPGALRRFLAGSETLEMRVLIEVQPDIGVTGLARVAAGEAA